ncbi:hypothetical protein A3715_18140 [Oleiphilus sp. HI0009]|nr:hypothetical protein A3715_18140 [Oleiphilus sp. HI0009]
MLRNIFLLSLLLYSVHSIAEIKNFILVDHVTLPKGYHCGLYDPIDKKYSFKGRHSHDSGCKVTLSPDQFSNNFDRCYLSGVNIQSNAPIPSHSCSVISVNGAWSFSSFSNKDSADLNGTVICSFMCEFKY